METFAYLSLFLPGASVILRQLLGRNVPWWSFMIAGWTAGIASVWLATQIPNEAVLWLLRR